MSIRDFRNNGQWPTTVWAFSPDNGRSSTLMQSVFNRQFVTRYIVQTVSWPPQDLDESRATRTLTDHTQGSVARSWRVFGLFMNLMRYPATPSSPCADGVGGATTQTQRDGNSSRSERWLKKL